MMFAFLSNLVSSALANLIPVFFSKKVLPVNNDVKQEGGTGNTGINNGTVNNTTNQFINKVPIEFKFKDLENSAIKKNARVLFVDDQDQLSTIKNLKKLGWHNVEQLEEENIQNTGHEKYKDADLIFVDFDGVGSAKRGQGLSVLSTLIANYGRKKYYLLHTAHPKKITLQKLAENGLPIQDSVGWSQLTKGSPDYLLETTMLNGLKQVER